MPKANVKKSEELSEDESTAFTILFTLMHAKNPLSLSEIAKETEMQANLVFYHLKIFMDKNIVLETSDKKYDLQRFFKDDDVSEDLDSLIMLMIKTIARELLKTMENPTEEKLSKAVINNLHMYVKRFEIEIE